jgi:hypothetical protein
MAPWWWFLHEPKHVGATVGILIVLIFLWFYNCVHHCGKIKSALILLMHGTNMKIEVYMTFQPLHFTYRNMISVHPLLTTHIGKPNKPSINTFSPPSCDTQQKLFEVWYNVKSKKFSNWNSKGREVEWQMKTSVKQEIGRNAIQVVQNSLYKVYLRISNNYRVMYNQSTLWISQNQHLFVSKTASCYNIHNLSPLHITHTP